MQIAKILSLIAGSFVGTHAIAVGSAKSSDDVWSTRGHPLRRMQAWARNFERDHAAWESQGVSITPNDTMNKFHVEMIVGSKLLKMSVTIPNTFPAGELPKVVLTNGQWNNEAAVCCGTAMNPWAANQRPAITMLGSGREHTIDSFVLKIQQFFQDPKVGAFLECDDRAPTRSKPAPTKAAAARKSPPRDRTTGSAKPTAKKSTTDRSAARKAAADKAAADLAMAMKLAGRK